MLITSTPIVSEPFTSDTGQFTSYTGDTLASLSISGTGILSSAIAAPGSRYAKTGSDVIERKHFVSMTIVNKTTVSAGYDMCGCGLVKDASNFIAAVYDRATGNIGIRASKGGAGVATLANVSFGFTPTYPFRIGLVINGNEATAIVNDSVTEENTWRVITSTRVDTVVINFAIESLTGWRYGFVGLFQAQSSWEIDNLVGSSLDSVRHASSANEDVLANAGSGFLKVTAIPSKRVANSSATETLAISEEGGVVITSGFNAGFN